MDRGQQDDKLQKEEIIDVFWHKLVPMFYQFSDSPDYLIIKYWLM